jgi:hypothetical protein
MEELQTDEATRARWIFYSALDAKATWELYHSLQVECCLSCVVLALLARAAAGPARQHTARRIGLALMRKPI